MAWKVIDGGFAYNEGSLNFTLRGAAFHDDDGDGVPDGVSFENGRPVFMNIKNLRDFHFDVPRGYLVVNGNEYKLVDLDGNNANGEELQLSKENVGFPKGEDRTNPAAYKKVGENQFTYNEGSLNYTLTGAAFHDNDGDGVPDGVRIIGPKPCFGPGFDTSVENFHFKVPSGSLMVNGQRYELAELDGNPDNGYELVIPEVEGDLGWTKVDGGFSYKRPADNNPTNMGGLKLFGDGLVDKNGDGEPDGVTVPTIRIGEMIGDVRVTKIGIDGLSGEVFLNHPQYSLGVIGDDDYNILIVKHGGDLAETVFSKISPGAAVHVTAGTENIQTDGKGNITVLAEKSFKIDGRAVQVDSRQSFNIQVDGDRVVSIDKENLGWHKVKGGFEFSGRPDNAADKLVTFKISGKKLKDADNDGAPDGVNVDVLRKVRGLGIRAGIDGLSGKVSLNGKKLGIKKDNDYAVHFTPLVDPNIAPENLAQVQSLEILKISPGASIKSPGNWIILDGDGTYHFSKGDYLVATKPAHSPADLQRISFSKGADLTVLNGEVVPSEKFSIVNGTYFNGSDETEKPAPQIAKDDMTEEKMYGAPLRVHGGGEGDSGEVSDGGAVEVADASTTPETSFDYKISSEENDETVDLSQSSEENVDEAPVSFQERLNEIRSFDVGDLSVGIDDAEYNRQADLNLPEFQQFEIWAALFQKNSSLAELQNQSSAFQPQVQIVQAEREGELAGDNFRLVAQEF